MNLSLSNFSLRKLKQRDITIIIIVLTILLAVAWYFYRFQPSQERIANLNTDISRLNTEIATGERARDNLPQLEEALAKANIERAEFLRQLPAESEVSQLLDTMRTSASDAGVILQSIGEGRSTQEAIQDVRPMGFSLATSGSYGPTMTFLSTLETLKRFTKVQQVGLTTEEDGVDNPNLNANFDFTVYVYTGEDPGAR